MKVAYINIVYGVKSTGRTYAELKEHLENQGHECMAFYGTEGRKEANVYRVGSRFSYIYHNIMSRITGLEGYFSHFNTIKLIKRLKAFNPDIIHLGSLHGHYLKLSVLYKYLSKCGKPVFMTAHDCWGFTGKCTAFTTLNCTKWKTGCYSCPSKKAYPKSYFLDFSRKIYNDKKSWLTAIDKLNVIAVSQWTGNQVKESFLKNKPIYINYNWINTDLFKPQSLDERLATRKALGIDKEDFLIISVSSLWNKQSPRYKDLSLLMESLTGNQKLLIVGSIITPFKPNDRVITLPFTSDVKYLADLYNSADAFVHFSMEDTFGKVIAEAQACGVPAIVYNSTACPEIAKIGNGYVVPPRDVNEAYRCIEKISTLSLEKREESRQERAALVKNMLNKQTRIEAIIDLYNKALKEN